MSLEATNSIRPQSIGQSLYARATRFVTPYTSPKTRDLLNGIWMPCAAAFSGIGYSIWRDGFAAPSIPSVLFFGTLLTVSALAIPVWSKHLTQPFIQKEIADIAEKSKHEPLKALSIDRGFVTYQILDHHKKLAEEHSIQYVQLSPSDRKLDVIYKITEIFDRIEFHVHGNKNAIWLESVWIDENSEPFFNWLNRRIKNQGIIVINSCSTAKGKQNIACRISEKCNAFVFASSHKINILSGTEYDDDQIPSFNDGSFCKGKDTTVVYQRGSKISRQDCVNYLKNIRRFKTASLLS